MVKILVATHKTYQMPKENIYLPIHVGCEGKQSLGYIGDNVGENISDKNANFCELTALYWAWKNLDCEIIGLVHYRRYFSSIRKSFSKKDKFKCILKELEINNLLDNYDVILPKKRNYFIDTVWQHYKNSHYIKDLEEVKSILIEKYPEYLESFNEVMDSKKISLYNMFVMRKELFDSYCNWLFDILFELESRIDISEYDMYQKRIFGFMSERLFNVWILQNNLNAAYLKVESMEKINWVNKIITFLKRRKDART